MTLLLILAVVSIFISGSPLFVVMLAGCAVGTLKSDNGFAIDFPGAVIRLFGTATGEEAEVLATIPMFIYAGYLLAEAKTADRLVRFANALLGWFPGGLAIVTIFTCALFTVFTGASGVTIIALGGVLMPALVKNGYPKKFSMGLIAGTGSVGLLFPPALPLFIYGAVAGLNIQQHQQDWLCSGDSVKDAAQALAQNGAQCWPSWDTQRFLLSGVIPGLVLVAMLAAVAIFVAIRGKLPTQKFDAKELLKSGITALPELLIPALVLGMLGLGFGPSEVAALTVVYVVVLETVVLRMITPKIMWTTAREAMAMVGAIFVIIFCAIAFTDYLVQERVPDAMVAWMKAHVDSKIAFLLAVNVILLVVGTVMDIFSAIVIVLPLVLPLAHAYNVDPYHLGVIFLLNLEVGYLHPPVGLNLFITSVKFQRPVTEVMWATIPFLITMILALVVITYVPQLTAWSTPEPEPPGRIADLVVIVHNAVEEKSALKQVALVTADGSPLLGDDGKQIVVDAKECDKVDDSKKAGCQELFVFAHQCAKDAKPDVCTHQKIAQWATRNRPDLVLVQEVALVTDDDPAPGRPIKDSAGKPIVMTWARCRTETDSDKKQACSDLFSAVSACKIDPGTKSYDACLYDTVTKWTHDNPP